MVTYKPIKFDEFEDLHCVKVHDCTMCLKNDNQYFHSSISPGNITLLNTMSVNNTLTVVEDYEYEVDPELVAAVEYNQQTIENMTQDIEDFAVTLDTDQVVDGKKALKENNSLDMSPNQLQCVDK